MNKHRPAGHSTREMASKRYKTRVWFVLLMTGIVLVLLFLLFWSSALGLSGLGILGLLFLIKIVTEFVDVRSRRMVKKERRAVRGAKAEEKIGAILEALGEDYLVIHDVVSPYGNIDHVVIGKPKWSSSD